MPKSKSLLNRLYNAPLMLESNAAQDLLAKAVSHIPGPQAAREEVGRFKQALMPLQKVGTTAVIQVFGPIVQRATAMEQMFFGLTSIEDTAALLNEARADSAVERIVLEIDTPGGEVAGLFELAEAVAATTADKEVIAVLNENALSAGYAIASGASRIVIPETGAAGSVGVILLHFDQSGALEKAGIKVTEIKAGERKSDGSPFVPLSEDAQQRLQARVDSIMDLFVQTVAQNRGMTEEAVRATEAGIFHGQAAVEVGFADEIGTFDTVMSTIVDGALTQNGEGIMPKKEKIVEDHVDEKLEAAQPAPEAPAEEPQTENLAAHIVAERCMEGGAPELTAKLIEQGVTEEQLQEKLQYAKDMREACKAAGFPKLASSMIKLGAPVEEVRESLMDQLADSEQEVSSKQEPEAASEEKTVNPIMADVEARRADWDKSNAQN